MLILSKIILHTVLCHSVVRMVHLRTLGLVSDVGLGGIHHRTVCSLHMHARTIETLQYDMFSALLDKLDHFFHIDNLNSFQTAARKTIASVTYFSFLSSATWSDAISLDIGMIFEKL